MTVRGQVLLVAGLVLATAACESNSATPPAPTDAGADLTAVLSPADAPAADAGAAQIPEVSVLGSTCLMPNPASSGLPNPASYDTAISGIVFDRLTGLMWQRSPAASTATQAASAMTCKNLKLGGFTDWRLPTLIELVSIVDFTATSPAVDAATFTGMSSNLYWTSTPLVNHPSNAWYVNFGPGNSDFLDVTASNLSRCVRTSMNMAGACFAAGARFAVDAGLVTDASTGLVWQQAVPAAPVTWPAAKAACAAAGAGFRLPSLKELQTLVDYAMSYPGDAGAPGAAIDPVAFPGTPPGGFWTSSPVSGSTAVAWIVKFDNGDTASNSVTAMTDTKYVRCVH